MKLNAMIMMMEDGSNRVEGEGVARVGLLPTLRLKAKAKVDIHDPNPLLRLSLPLPLPKLTVSRTRPQVALSPSLRRFRISRTRAPMCHREDCLLVVIPWKF